MLSNIKYKFWQTICLGVLCFGQSSFANEPTLMDWYKMITPNYVQFQQAYGEKLDGTVFSQMLRPSREQIFSDQKLSSEQIQLGAKLSEQAYYHCMVWGYDRLTTMFGDNDIDKIADGIFALCQDHEDIYDIYNILLASDHYGFEMTEYKAWQRIQANQQQGIKDNRDFRQAVKKQLVQLNEASSAIDE
ncbi:hypothetical protein [Moraxella sp.]|uniref:hypothetical protein n=1 Tax=Moraxella sp. TaxID=479 RepID=UPI0026DC4068|nr:hypothetical protein [Moraxella sp.]MDO4894418.1 hypothetical protein [Moraxella sp.]